MSREVKHSINQEALEQIQARLHRIPEQYPLDRTTSPTVVKRRRLIWLPVALSVAATVALVLLIFPMVEKDQSDQDLDTMINELYSLGYVEEEDIYDFIEPDSLEFAGGTVDADVYYDYYDNSDNYLLEL